MASPTAAAMVAEANSEVGFKEGPNNQTKYGAWYGLNYEPWCAMYLSWCANQIGADTVVGKFAYCPSWVNWFKARGQWHGPTEAVQLGDIVFFSWDGGPVADHVGVARAVATAGSSIPTTEGNTSSGASGSQGNGDGVYQRLRPRSVVLGFGRPAYASAPAPKPTPSPKPTKYAPPPFPTGLAPNRSNPSAQPLQKALKATGWMNQGVTLSDNYGPLTQKGVAGFNAKHSLNDTGRSYDPAIGPRGWALLLTLAYS
ncbi:CHAP domain-containing protein [Streptomyces noursei]|uniref:CHAP domain-containing protein n=1 Tax=Streptomyces noursei TaxID=1971 RepID=UPI003450DC97